MLRRASFAVAVLAAFAASVHAEDYTFWVEPCAAPAAASTGCHADDPELARWALEAWQRESNGGLTVRESSTSEHARIRIRWAGGAANLYGETEPTLVDGRPGANIFVLPDVRALGREISAAAINDPLLRDAVIYLTCVHESGHAFGLPHTRDFDNIMYSFQYGGDIVDYFERYRRQLKTRADIQRYSGTSAGDRTRLRALLSH